MLLQYGHPVGREILNMLFPTLSFAFKDLTENHESSRADILFYGRRYSEMSLLRNFTGTVIELNGESDVSCLGSSANRAYIAVGPSDPACNVTCVFYPYAAFVMSVIPMFHRTTLESRKSPIIPSKFLLYTNSHCVKHRESAFNVFVKRFPQKVIHAGGSCHGAHRGKSNRVNGTWVDLKRSTEYKFVFAMENALYPGYVTEKLPMAFMTGAIPIYWGSQDAKRLFNHHAFLWYNAKNPRPTLSLVEHLDKNDTAYLEMRRRVFMSHMGLKFQEETEAQLKSIFAQIYLQGAV